MADPARVRVAGLIVAAAVFVGDQAVKAFVVRALALPARLAIDVLPVFRNLAPEGLTLIVSTPEMPFASAVADRVCFLHSGNIVEQGTTDRVLGNPQEPRTRDFLRRVLREPAIHHCEHCRKIA